MLCGAQMLVGTGKLQRFLQQGKENVIRSPMTPDITTKQVGVAKMAASFGQILGSQPMAATLLPTR